MATHSIPVDRNAALRRARQLEYVTVGWNSIEAIASIIAGILAGSIALVAFGLDSVIETISGSALLWRLHHSNDNALRRETSEKIALRIVGVCFVLLSIYVLADSAHALMTHEAPERSL